MVPWLAAEVISKGLAGVNGLDLRSAYSNARLTARHIDVTVM